MFMLKGRPDSYLNADLKSRIEEVFKPLRIIGYSGCCRLGCTGSYDEFDRSFVLRTKGITYFRLHLSGMNYDSFPTGANVHYEGGVEYLNAHWDEELALITQWCGLLGLALGEFKVQRPRTSAECITVTFARPLVLELKPKAEDESDYDHASLNYVVCVIITIVYQLCEWREASRLPH
jgi:hypothetical protein